MPGHPTGVDMGDHPPITPVRAATEGQLGDAYRLYDPWPGRDVKQPLPGYLWNFMDICFKSQFCFVLVHSFVSTYSPPWAPPRMSREPDRTVEKQSSVVTIFKTIRLKSFSTKMFDPLYGPSIHQSHSNISGPQLVSFART